MASALNAPNVSAPFRTPAVKEPSPLLLLLLLLLL
jgi:hypothetical protein